MSGSVSMSGEATPFPQDSAEGLEGAVPQASDVPLTDAGEATADGFDAAAPVADAAPP